MEKSIKKYNAWKCDSNANPIEGTDRIISGRSKRAILKHLAYEEGVEYIHNSMILRLPNGEFWAVSSTF